MSHPTKSTKPLSPQETLEHMKNCEAIEWQDRYKNKAYEHGVNHARAWWAKTIADIERRRGYDAAYDLRRRMNKLKETQK